MSVAEKRAAEIEIKKQLDEFDRKHAVELDALVLWILHTEFGFGEKRLRRFYERFGTEIRNLTKRYLLEDDDAVWLCTFKLEEAGIDIKKWNEDFTKMLEGE